MDGAIYSASFDLVDYVLCNHQQFFSRRYEPVHPGHVSYIVVVGLQVKSRKHSLGHGRRMWQPDCGVPAWLASVVVVGAQPASAIVFPFVDGTILTQTLDAAFASGQFNHVPVISRGNHDEWRLFVAFQYDLLGTPLTDAGYLAAVAAFEFSTVSDPFVLFLVNMAYPLINYPPPPPFLVSAPLALGALGTDELFACPERNADKLLSQYVRTYTYEFNDETAPLSLGIPLSFPLGAAHFAEVPYLFTYFGIPASFTPDQQQLSNTMISYWTHFAETGNPNSAGEPLWSPYSSTTDEFQSLVPPTPTVESNFDAEHQCTRLWNTF